MFKVSSPGNVTNLDHLGYYAIGSGTKMALASLNLRPLDNLSAGGLAYRLCEAKFSTETAAGAATTGFFMNMHGYSSPMTLAWLWPKIQWVSDRLRRQIWGGSISLLSRPSRDSDKIPAVSIYPKNTALPGAA
jgi:hypothetical protein